MNRRSFFGVTLIPFATLKRDWRDGFVPIGPHRIRFKYIFYNMPFPAKTVADRLIKNNKNLRLAKA